MSNTNNSPQSWRLITVKDAIKEKILEKPLDGNHGEIHPKGDDFVSEGIPFIMASDLKNGGVDLINCSFIRKTQAERLRKGFAKSGDVLLSHKATIGRVALLKTKLEYVVLTPQVTYYRVKDESKLSNEYLKYYFQNNNFQKTLISYSGGGSTRAYIGITSQLDLPLVIPPINEQKAIALVISAFDDKIELLQAQNNTLEQTAQTIFKEWFGKYQVGDELPEGWRVGNLDEVTKTVGGTTPSTKNPEFWNGSINWSSPKDLSYNEYIYILSTEKKITENGLKRISSGLLPKNTLLLSSRAPVGYLALTNVELAINQGYIAILPCQYFSNYYTFLWLKKNMKKVINAANGSTFLEISKSAFRTIDCVIPEKSKIEDFDKIVAPFFKKTLSNQIQIQTLKETRDTVLPKLISGQLRVKDFKE